MFCGPREISENTKFKKMKIAWLEKDFKTRGISEMKPLLLHGLDPTSQISNLYFFHFHFSVNHVTNTHKPIYEKLLFHFMGNSQHLIPAEKLKLN